MDSQDDICLSEPHSDDGASAAAQAEAATEPQPEPQGKEDGGFCQPLNDIRLLSSLRPLDLLLADMEEMMSGKLSPEQVEKVIAATRERERLERLARLCLDSDSVVTDVSIRPTKLTDGLSSKSAKSGVPFSSLRSLVFTIDDSHLVCATERGLLVFLDLSLYSFD